MVAIIQNLSLWPPPKSQKSAENNLIQLTINAFFTLPHTLLQLLMMLCTKSKATAIIKKNGNH